MFKNILKEFENLENTYFLVLCAYSDHTIDDNSITKSSPLNDRAIITVDSNKYIFVALCNEDFTW